MTKLEDRLEITDPEQPHVATVLLLDISGSMEGDKIRQVNEGLQYFKDDVSSDDLTRKRLDFSIITFGSAVDIFQPFCNIENFNPPALQAGGTTCMGGAILKAIDLIETRKQEYRSKGIDFYRPWIFMVTDGNPTDMTQGDPLWNEVVKKINDGEANKKFLFFTVGVDSADMDLLGQLAPHNRVPVRLMKNKFKEMFLWFSKSQQKVSASKIGEQVALDNPVGPKGWAEASTT
jgi:uncharacterized protein YegL